jgi:lipopolysaccharide export system protein LptA
MKIQKWLVAGLMAGLLSVGATCFAASSVAGDKVEYDFRTGQAVAQGNVKLRHDKGTASAREAEYNTKTGEGKLTGSVVADQEDAHLTCATLIIKNKGNYLSAIGNAVMKKADKTLRSEQVNYDSDAKLAETIGDWAQLTMDDGSSLDAASMRYNMDTNKAHAEGNVRLISPPRSLTARADTADYDMKDADGTIYLRGHATATQDGNTVSGDALTIRGAGGKIAQGDGNVKMVVIQKQPAPTGEETAAGEEPVISVAGKEPVPSEVYKFYHWPGEAITYAADEAELA